MTIYETIKARLGDGPAVPTRKEYTKYFGYAGGKCLGCFGSIGEAEQKGAVTTEKVFDEAGWQEATALFTEHRTKISEAWYAALRQEYPHVSDAAFKVIFNRAWNEGHSSGHNEVENILIGLVDFALAILETRDA